MSAMRRFSFFAPLAAFLTAVFLLLAASAGARAAESEQVYGLLLQKYVSEGGDGIAYADYKAWHGTKADRAMLDGYIGWLTAQKPSAMARNAAFAYWANLYNALTLKVILDNYPVKSIRDIASTGTSLFDFKAYSGPWRTKRATVEGKELSLDEIEHEILRPQFKDARVHYAVNCASVGCPNLMARPWAADTLDADLDAAARAYVNHPRGVSVAADGSVTVSSIYNWFQADFGGSEAGVLDHLRKYAGPELKQKLEGKTGYDSDAYDWSLNEVKASKTAG
jgi:hypothetical protein